MVRRGLGRAKRNVNENARFDSSFNFIAKLGLEQSDGNDIKKKSIEKIILKYEYETENEMEALGEQPTVAYSNKKIHENTVLQIKHFETITTTTLTSKSTWQ